MRILHVHTYTYREKVGALYYNINVIIFFQTAKDFTNEFH